MVDLGISGGFARFAELATERVRTLAELDRALVAELLDAAEASAFFIREDLAGSVPDRPDMRIYRIRLVHAGRSRVLTISEPFKTPDLARLVRAVRRGL